MSRLVIRQFKSAIGEKHAAKETLASIGLRRPGNVVVREDSPTLRGKIRKIAHLVEVRADRRTQTVDVDTDRRAAPKPATSAAAKASSRKKGWQRRQKAAEPESAGSSS